MKHIKNYLIFEKNQQQNQQQNIVYYFIIQKGGTDGIGEIGYIYLFIVTEEEYNNGLNATEQPIPIFITNILNNYGVETEDDVWEIPESDEQIVRSTLINNGLEEKPFIYPADRQPYVDDKSTHRGWFSDKTEEIDHLITTNLANSNLKFSMRYKIKNPEYIVFKWSDTTLIIGKIIEQIIFNNKILKIGSKYKENDINMDVKIEIIDSLTHYSYSKEKHNTESDIFPFDDRMKILLLTPNKTDAIKKFKNLINKKPYSNWILKRRFPKP